jgi:hypothetical protein
MDCLGLFGIVWEWYGLGLSGNLFGIDLDLRASFGMVWDGLGWFGHSATSVIVCDLGRGNSDWHSRPVHFSKGFSMTHNAQSSAEKRTCLLAVSRVAATDAIASFNGEDIQYVQFLDYFLIPL